MRFDPHRWETQQALLEKTIKLGELERLHQERIAEALTKGGIQIPRQAHGYADFLAGVGGLARWAAIAGLEPWDGEEATLPDYLYGISNLFNP